MARILWLADSLRSAGLTVRETNGWETRERPASTGGFAPEGVLLHHTAAYATADNPHPSLNTVIEGRGGADPLPGPLCHVLIDRNSVCWVIAAGRANHAGAAVASGPMPAGDGNEMYVGIEVEYAATNHSPTQYATRLPEVDGHRRGGPHRQQARPRVPLRTSAQGDEHHREDRPLQLEHDRRSRLRPPVPRADRMVGRSGSTDRAAGGGRRAHTVRVAVSAALAVTGLVATAATSHAASYTPAPYRLVAQCPGNLVSGWPKQVMNDSLEKRGRVEPALLARQRWHQLRPGSTTSRPAGTTCRSGCTETVSRRPRTTGAPTTSTRAACW